MSYWGKVGKNDIFKSSWARLMSYWLILFLLISVVFVVTAPVKANSPPGIEITYPKHEQNVSGIVIIWMVAWDPDGNDQIQDVWVKFDDNPTWLNATYNHTDAEGQWWYYEWNTTTFEEGWHKITAIAFDGFLYADHHIEVNVDNIPDNNPPGIEIVDPKDGDTVKGIIIIWMVAWDPDGNGQIQDVWVKIGDKPKDNATYNHTDAEGQWWYYEWNTTEVDDGWYAIRAIVFDGIDDAHHVIEVEVDNVPENSPPGIEIVEPKHGDTVSGIIVIWMVAWDPDGNDQIQDVWVKIDDKPKVNATYNHTTGEGQWWYYEWDTTEVEDGWHSIRAIVFDGIDDAHDVIEVKVHNVVENSPPGIEIVEPKHGETVKGIVVIWMVAWDPDGNDQIQDVWVKFDDDPTWLNATYNHTDAEGQWWYYEWDTTTFEEGWHKITAIAFDGFLYADDHIEVFVDNVPENSPPGIEIVEPKHGETVSGVVVIWMVAWDPDGNDQIQDVWVKIDDNPKVNATYNHTTAEGQWWYYEWDTTQVDDGWHAIRAIVFDGIDDASDVIEVKVDNVVENSPPGIEIVEPKHGETLSGIVVIWMVAWDPDGNNQIENVWVRIDGGELRNATYNHTTGEGQWWYYEWDTTEVEDGWHSIKAIVFDGIDDGHDIIEVKVENIQENNPPGIEIVEPKDGETGKGVIVIWMVAWDPDGNDQIQDVWVKIDNGALRNATYNHTDAEGQWWYYEWDTNEVEDGWHLITAIVYDGIDDAHDAIEVFVDNLEPEEGGFLLALVLAAIGACVVFSLFAMTEVGKFALLSLIFLPLYTKIGKKKILDHFVRGQIYGYIKVHPGDNYTTIKKNLDLNNGTLTYHLKVLEREGLIKSWTDGSRKYFYPQGVKIPGDGVKNSSIYDTILNSIKESPGISIKDIAAVNGISRQLANYHVKKLAAEGEIELERKSFSKACFPKKGN